MAKIDTSPEKFPTYSQKKAAKTESSGCPWPLVVTAHLKESLRKLFVQDQQMEHQGVSPPLKNSFDHMCLFSSHGVLCMKN